MINLEKMLDELKIRYVIQSKVVDSITFLCIIDNKDGTKFPLRINVSKKNGILGFYSGHTVIVDKSDLDIVYPILNELNAEYALGTYYLDKKNRIHYYIGVSIEDDDPQLSVSQLNDYIRSVEIANLELIYRLVEEKVISNNDEKEGSHESE